MKSRASTPPVFTLLIDRGAVVHNEMATLVARGVPKPIIRSICSAEREERDGQLISLNELRRIHHMAMTPGGALRPTRTPLMPRHQETFVNTTYIPSVLE